MRVEKSIYFMRPVGSVGPIKIGCSRWPSERIAQISTWSPVPLEIIATAPGSGKLESFLHRKFKALRSHREWFRVSQELLDGIAAVSQGASIEAAFGAVRKTRPTTYDRDAHVYVPQVRGPAA